MITARSGFTPRGWRTTLSMTLVMGCCWTWGCATPSTRDTTASRDATNSADAAIVERAAAGPEAPDAMSDSTECADRPIERVEELGPDGTLRFREEVVIDDEGNEIPHGLTTQFWPNGQKRLEMEYNCGVKDGPRVTWYQDGKIWSQGAFADGRDHGHWVVWFPDGTKSQEFTMIRGMWHGVHTLWDATGQKRREVAWVNGKRQGPLRVWDEEGNLISEEQYVDDIEQPTPIYHADSDD